MREIQFARFFRTSYPVYGSDAGEGEHSKIGPSVWVWHGIVAVKAGTIAKAKLCKCDLDFPWIKSIFSGFVRSPSTPISFGNCKGVRFLRLNGYVRGDRKVLN